MSDGPVAVAAYETLPEAYHTKGFLESRGIRAFVADGLTGSWMGIYNRSIGGIRVMVAPEDADRALAELETWEVEKRGARGGGEVPEPDAEPDVGDGVDSDLEPAEDRVGESSVPLPVGDEAPKPATQGGAPQPVSTADPSGEDYARRTRVFAIIGLAALFFSPIALIRAFSTPPGVEFSPRSHSMLRQARLIGTVGCVLLGVVIYRVFHR